MAGALLIDRILGDCVFNATRCCQRLGAGGAGGGNVFRVTLNSPEPACCHFVDAAEALAARAREVVGYLGVWLPCFCLSLIFAAGVSPKAGSPFQV